MSDKSTIYLFTSDDLASVRWRASHNGEDVDEAILSYVEAENERYIECVSCLLSTLPNDALYICKTFTTPQSLAEELGHGKGISIAEDIAQFFPDSICRFEFVKMYESSDGFAANFEMDGASSGYRLEIRCLTEAGVAQYDAKYGLDDRFEHPYSDLFNFFFNQRLTFWREGMIPPFLR